jgi:RHS repeat-associated protein
VRAQPPSLPTGGGAIRSIGEKFSANAATGTGSLSIPIATPPARGFAPELALHYDSGAGNGPFGAGWRLSVPNITRKTDKQLPTYLDVDGEDVFVLSGAEDLVAVPGGEPGVTRYRPRVDGAFARIERHVTPNGTWWVSITADNVRSTYGQTAAARIADPVDPTRVFSWLLERTEDSLGNVVLFDHVAEDLANVAPGAAEQHRLDGLAPIANTYLSAIRYGVMPDDPNRFAFTIVFDYGDRVGDSPIRTAGLWPARRDAFSSYRAGFDVRTYRRCRRVLTFHDIPALAAAPQLVRALELAYDDDPALAHMVSARSVGYGTAGDTLATPTVRLAYTTAAPDGIVHALALDSLGDLPEGIDGTHHQWIDLDGEGIAGVLTDELGGLYFRRNLGSGLLGPARTIASIPTIAAPSGGQHLMDIDGDGRLDLVMFDAPLPGFHARVPASGASDGDWEAFQPFASLPQIAWADPNVRFIDLDGDGIDDVLVAKDDTFVWYPSLGANGFGPPRILPRPSDEERGPAIVFADVRRTILLADLSGDGLRDLVRVENGSICYWPNLGQGKFGAKVTMANPPVFDAPDGFDAKRVLFADIDGTGTSDVLYAGGHGVRYWLNQAGNAWSDPTDVALPPDHSVASVTAIDVLGTGTACLAWSSPAPGDAAIRYIDLCGGIKPHLLAEVDNGLGLTTRVAYASSTSFYLADRAAGIHWATQLPFPVHVVARVEVDDAIRKVQFVSEYAYRDGYYDGYEREFRGFGYVEQRDTESDPAQLGVGLFADRPPPRNGEVTQPVVTTKTWFHTGVWLDGTSRVAIPDGLTTAESRDAYRALRGSVLRQQIFADDGPLAALPYVDTEHGYEVRCFVRATGDAHGVFACFPRETIETHTERDPTNPRIQHVLALDTDDRGHVRQQATIGYPCRAPGAKTEQTTLLAMLAEHDVATELTHPDWYRHGMPLESRAYELVGLPDGPAPLAFGDVLAIASSAVAIAYDAPLPAKPYKRLVDRTRARYYDSNALPSPLPFGQIDARALPYSGYGLAFTPTLVASLFAGRMTDATLQAAGYTHLDDDPDNWWMPSGRSVPDASMWYLPTSYIDPFGSVTTLAYDAPRLAVASVTDPVQNTTTAEIDYRVMAPVTLTDANHSRSHVTFDPLGRVTALWLTGAAGEGDPFTGDPTVKFDYAFYNAASGTPSVAHSAARETFASPTTKWQHSYEYSDGAGQIVMKKVQAEPGLAKQLQADGTCADVQADPRWVGNGRTVFDNKGHPIKQYEPYFSVTSGYEDEDALVCQGVTVLLHYDPIGRVTSTEYPDGSVARVELGAWQQKSFDRNDTILEAGNAWYAHWQGQRVATITQPHAGTATLARFDTLGRTYSVTADNGGGLFEETRTTYDIEGNPLVVRDALGRACMQREFNMIGQACHQTSIDAGDRWALVDASGQEIWRYDARGQTIRTSFDAARRPIAIAVEATDGTKLVTEQTVWGEGAPSTVAYARGRVYQRRDGAGLATIESYDFRGNVASSARQLATDYTKTPDWSQSPPLDNEVFRVATEYDALNRPTKITAPDGSVAIPGYNATSLLDSVDVQIRGATPATPFVTNIDYNEKGQRTQIVYGNAATTTYGYELETLRLSTLKTVRASDGRALQQLSYTYDPVGNVVEIDDAVQKPVFHDGNVTDGSARYTYYPVYRLWTATGREHAAGLGAPRTDVDIPAAPLPDPSNDAALIPYGETYQYDAVGNIQQIAHGASVDGAPAWTYPMHYAAGTNRLSETMIEGDLPSGPWHGVYTYDAHGNMTAMPHLARIDWDWKDQMQRADKGGGGAVYFTYDASGERVRKVWEHGGTIEERIYLGGYEVYRQRTGTKLVLERQTLHVMDGVRRIAMVETKTVDTSVPALQPTPVIRLQLGNHLGSAMLELDETGRVISYEEFHPFGTSSYRAQSSAVEVSLKRYRYTGKERDEETSLEYHSARYYAPWLGRWTATDPARSPAQRSLYEYCRNSPLNAVDHDGRNPKPSSAGGDGGGPLTTEEFEEFYQWFVKNVDLSVAAGREAQEAQQALNRLMEFVKPEVVNEVAEEVVKDAPLAAPGAAAALAASTPAGGATAGGVGGALLEVVGEVGATVLGGALVIITLGALVPGDTKLAPPPPKPKPRAKPLGVGELPARYVEESKKVNPDNVPRVGPVIPTAVELNQLFAEKLAAQNQRLQGNLGLIKKYEPKLYARIMSGKMPHDITWMLARIAYGKTLEKMVAEDLKKDPRTRPYFEYVSEFSGAYKPDFVGHGPLEGVSFDITTVDAIKAHRARPYGKELVLHVYRRPADFP